MKSNKLLPELYMTSNCSRKNVIFPKILSNFKSKIKTFNYLKNDKELNSSSKEIPLHLKTLSLYGKTSKNLLFNKNNYYSKQKSDIYSKTLGKTSLKEFLRTKFFSSNKKNSKELSSPSYLEKKIEEHKSVSYSNIRKDKIQNIKKLFNNTEVNQAKNNFSKKIEIKKITRKFINSLIINTKILKYFEINPKLLLYNNPFPQKPFDPENSEEFFEAIKSGNINKVHEMISFNKFIVFSFDNLSQTPLHWAAKRDCLHIVLILIKEMPYLDLKDICGRTALYVASKRNNFEIVKALIEAKANFKLENLSGFRPIDVAKSEKLKILLFSLRANKKEYK